MSCMGSSKTPAFLHQSYEHKTVLEPCGFASIAAVRPPDGVAGAGASPTQNKRWLVWVDKRRGLLGRTSVLCPARVDPPPGRRKSLPFSTLSKTQLNLEDYNQSDDMRARRSLPLLSGPESETIDGPNAAQHETQQKRPNDGTRLVVKVSAAPEKAHLDAKNKQSASVCYQQPLTEKTHLEEQARGRVDASSEAPMLPSFEEENKADVQILLRDLNRPSRVAAGAGAKCAGVYFIDHVATVDNNKLTTALSLHTRLHQATIEHGENTPSNFTQATLTGRLRFLRWGAQQAVTIVERLCNPLALCVASDSSVFVLEEAWEGSNDQGRGRRTEHHRIRRHRVCRLRGARLSEWLHIEAKRSAAKCRKETTAEYSRVDQNYVRGETDEQVSPDDESETDWDTSSHSTGSFGNDGGDSSCPVKAHVASRVAGSHSRHRGVINFEEVLELSLLQKQRNPPEQPVDMCVLTDGTVVIAYCRLAQLHDGAAIAENQGVVRIFPAIGRKGGYSRPTSIDTAKGLVRSPVAASSSGPDNREGLLYDTDKSYLVAEGLPVITGVVAGGGNAVYLSFCGASRDGKVTAIGSVLTRRSPIKSSKVSASGTFVGAKEASHRGSARGEPVTTGGVSGHGEKCVGGDNGGSFLRVVSGFAAALAVDTEMNLFYVTAENKGSCCALWCNTPGAGRRRVSSLGMISPLLCVTAIAPSLTSTPDVKRTSADRGAEEVFYIPKKANKGDRHARRIKAKAEAAAEAEATAIAAAKRAVALSAALIEETEAFPTSSGSRKPLFESRRVTEVSTAGSLGSKETSGEEDENGPINIVVVSRCRPLLEREIKRGVRAAVCCDGDEVVVSGKDLPIDRSRRFGFDRVFGPNTSQARVYAEAVAPVVCKMLDGFNCSVLAYGQTGSGKTFTMEGGLSVAPSGPSQQDSGERRGYLNAAEVPGIGNEDPVACIEKMGVIPRAVHTIFREGDGEGTRRYWVYVSHMEIYNERLFDLLAPEAATVAPNSPTHRSPRPAGPGLIGGLPRENAPRPLSPSGQQTVGTDKAPYGEHASARQVFPSSPPRRSNRGACGTGQRSASNKLQPGAATSPRSLPLGAGERPIGSVHAGGGSGGEGRGAGSGMERGLTIEEHRELGVMVKGLTQVEVKSPEDIFAIIARSKRNRRTAETMCNVESSRSHGVFSVRVISAEPTPWGGEITRDGRLSLVDLSGSENIKRSGAVGVRAKEAAAIGQSLLALGRVIKALVHSAPHVPYRESKLTRVLADSLGGNAFTAIILNVTPNHGMLDETLNTLAYAKTAQSVKNTPKQHIVNRSPAEDATTINSGSPSDSQSISCNIAKELKRWRGGAAVRLASGPSRVHIRPWEGKVPIHASASSNLGPSTQLPQQTLLLSPRPFNGPRDETGGGGCRGGGWGGRDEKVSISLPHRRCDGTVSWREREDRRRPATAGEDTETRNKTTGTTVSSGGVQRCLVADEQDSPRVAGGVGVRHGQRATKSATAGFPLGLFSGTLKQQLMSENGSKRKPEDSVQTSGTACNLLAETATSYSTLRGRRPGGGSPRSDGEAERVFDSTAAEWVRSVVLEPGKHAGRTKAWSQTQDSLGVLGDICSREDAKLTAGAKTVVQDDVRLTSGAKAAAEEVFDRFDREGRGFLLASEISALQEIWTGSDAQAPPPQQFTPPSLLHPRGKPRISKARGGSTVGPAKVESSDNNHDTRALTREAFLEFCLWAAARDAIFIRHLFLKGGYNFRLELQPPATTVAAPAIDSVSLSMTKMTSTGLQKRGPQQGHFTRKNNPVQMESKKLSSRERSNSKQGQPRRDASRQIGPDAVGGSCARSRGSKGRGMEQSRSYATIPQEPELCCLTSDDGRCIATGGIVYAADLWDWTEDKRDHGKQHTLQGLLSRGGGAHVSRVAAATVTKIAGGDFLNRSRTKKLSSTSGAVVGGTASSPGSPTAHEGLSPNVSSFVAVPKNVTHTDAKVNPQSTTSSTTVGLQLDKGVLGQGGAQALPEDRSNTPGYTPAGTNVGAPTIETQTARKSGDDIASADMIDEVRKFSLSGGFMAGGRSTCEWCGGVVRSDVSVMPAAVHTAAFCDDDLLHVR